MGVTVAGNGRVVLKNRANIEKLKEKLDELENAIDYRIEENILTFDEWDDHWHENTTLDFLDALIDYIKEGSATYSDYCDDGRWRYVYDSEYECWDQEDAYIGFGFEDYGDDELIEELEKRGYKVMKSNSLNELINEKERWKERYEELNKYVEDTYDDFA